MNSVLAAEPRAERTPWLAHDPASRRVLELACRAAASAATVLITGESGAGKDQLARLIHEWSPRRDAPCLKIDCASLPAELVESELFGHEKGAFTGAIAAKRGRLELAGRGTVVLDEVAALAPAVQAKLLRVLDERVFERLGGCAALRIEARLVALTNADLDRLVAAGFFREDLYFRLDVLRIAIPPLRERRGDIRPLAEHLLSRLAPVHARPLARFDPAAIERLEAGAWPGNVRELKNAIERALVFAHDDLLRAEDFPLPMAPGSPAAGAALRSLGEMECEAIRHTLECTRYRIAQAAAILGISRKTLLAKRKKYGLR
jgi:DNA-binding NtrC family response regulator